MRLIETIDRVNDFEVSIEELIWKENKVLLNRELLFEGEVVLMNSNDNLIVLQTDDSGTIVIDRDTKTEYQIDKSGPIISENLLLLGKWNDDYSARMLYAWDFKKNVKVWECESYFGQPVTFSNYLFGTLRSSLFRIDPNSGESHWQLDLAENYGIYFVSGEESKVDTQGYIGVYNDNLYIKVGNRLILGVNIISGEEVFKYEYQGEDLLLDNLQLDSTNEIIFSIGPSSYFELSLLSNNAEISSIKEEVQKHNVETTRLGSWESDFIYFWEGSVNSKFGIFERSSKTIKLVGDIAGNEGKLPAIKSLKYGQDRIYVLDNSNRLHIFRVGNQAT